MKLSGNTILITGGSAGIGLALAQRLHISGSKIIICGRRTEKLREAESQLPGVVTRVCDVAKVSDRGALFKWVAEHYPETNVLINNAGIQRRVNFLNNEEEWSRHSEEIAINLEAPIHLSALFIPHLLKQKSPYIVNVSSGLAFIPGAFAPVYSASKAALHSFTMSLRHQLSQTPVKVVEVIPPAVQTDLGGPGLHTFGVPLDEFADSVIKNLESGAEEFGYGTSETGRKASRQEIDAGFTRMNKNY